MSNFKARTITGFSMVFLLLFSLWYDPWLFAGFLLIVVILGIWEFYSLFSSMEIQPQKIYGTACAAILYLLVFVFNLNEWKLHLTSWYYFPVFSAMAMFFFSFIIEIYRKKERPFENIAFTAMGILYIALPLALLNLMYTSHSASLLGFPAYLLGYFFITWIYDTGAYLYGKQFGKHKLFERISPKKTWEGTIAGAVVALLFAFSLSLIVADISRTDWFVLAMLVMVFGTFGDLTESLLKRSLNIKDSGNILPGHGGILDRFDTIFISSPFVFLYFIVRNL